MRAGTRYKLPSGTEPEACPCSELHIGPSQPRGWFSRVSGTRFNFHTSFSHQYLEVLVKHALSPMEGFPGEHCSLLLPETTELSHHSLHCCHSSHGTLTHSREIIKPYGNQTQYNSVSGRVWGIPSQACSFILIF